MLGQEDGNPNATSRATDSFTQKPVWKRMIVISGGVVMNVILAAVLFMIVFLVGMKEVPPVAGRVAADSPAARAGLQAGDVILEINGRRAQSFTDLAIASAMSGPDKPVKLEIERGDERLTLSPVPREGPDAVLKTIGVAPPSSLTLRETDRAAPRDMLVRQFADWGLEGVEPGMRVIAINAQPIEGSALPSGEVLDALERVRAAASASGGKPLSLTFRDDATGQTAETTVTPVPELNSYAAMIGDANHLLGLLPLMKVKSADEESRGYAQGLRTGDVFLRIGDAEFPSIPQAIEAIRMRTGKPLSLRLLRDAEAIDLDVTVDKAGRIGFDFGQAIETPILATTPLRADARKADLPAAKIEPPLPPGSLIVAVDDMPVASFLDIRAAIQERVTAGAFPAITIASIPPGEGARSPTLHEWTLTPDEIRSVAGLAWTIEPGLEAQFQIATMTLRAETPLQAMVMGVRKTHRIMMLTYLTFQRLIQGTVSPKELRGPVGITHIGSQYAAQGFVYLLFFLALISANLAVINFLPIPIVDGGLFVMLLYEGITRRPVPIVVQNVATAIGLALIITVFIFITVQDIGRLF